MIDCERYWTILPEDAVHDIDKRSMIWGMFMSSALEASVFMGKNHSDNLHSIKNTGNDLTLKKMFDISEKLIVEKKQMGFLECLKSAGKILHGNSDRWSMMKKSSVSRMQRFMYVQILCFVLERWIRTQHQILFGKNSWVGSKIHHNTELWTQLTESRWNSSGIFSQDSLHCSSSTKSKSSWTKWATHNISEDEFSSCRCSMTSYGELKTISRNVLPMPHLCLYLQKDFQHDVGQSSDLDQKRSGILLTTKDHEENGTESLYWWWSNSEKADTQFSEPRVHCPEERSKAKEVENIDTLLCRWRYEWNCFRTNISVNQLSIYGAVSDLCEEYSTSRTRTGRPVLAGQYDPLFEPASLLTTTPTLSDQEPFRKFYFWKF